MAQAQPSLRQPVVKRRIRTLRRASRPSTAPLASGPCVVGYGRGGETFPLSDGKTLDEVPWQ